MVELNYLFKEFRREDDEEEMFGLKLHYESSRFALNY